MMVVDHTIASWDPPDFLSRLPSIAPLFSEVNPLCSGARLIGWRPVLTKSPLRPRVPAGYEREVQPPPCLLPPAREAAVGPRLLIRRENPAYLAANLSLRSFHYPPPVDALGCSYSSAPRPIAQFSTT